VDIAHYGMALSFLSREWLLWGFLGDVSTVPSIQKVSDYS
jgi:hypothetical protein